MNQDTPQSAPYHDLERLLLENLCLIVRAHRLFNDMTFTVDFMQQLWEKVFFFEALILNAVAKNEAIGPGALSQLFLKTFWCT